MIHHAESWIGADYKHGMARQLCMFRSSTSQLLPMTYDAAHFTSKPKPAQYFLSIRSEIFAPFIGPVAF